MTKPGDEPMSISLPVSFADFDTDQVFTKAFDRVIAEIINEFAASDPNLARIEKTMDDILTGLVDMLMEKAEQWDLTEELAEAIEPTAPKVAEHVRSLKSPEAVTAYINLVIAVVNLILLLHNTFSHPPPPGVTQQIVFNITNVTNSPAPVKQIP